MNPNTGHLIALHDGTSISSAYDRLPKRLLSDAQQELSGKSETYVDLMSDSPLADWAKKKRKAKAKKKIAAASRRRNRK